MNSFPNQAFSNQPGPHFGAVVPKVYGNYAGNVENGDGQFNLPPVMRGEMDNSNIGNLCDACTGYSEQIDYLSHENELLHQLVDNLRKRPKDSQTHNSLHMARKYEASGSAKESKVFFANNEVAVTTSVERIFKQYGASQDEDKITINRLKSEMDFYKALNTNTESVWSKKLDDLQAEKDSVIKELQKFIADNTETINRLTKELETIKHSKQDTINKLTSEVFSVKSSSQKTIATLTGELEKNKAEKRDIRDRMFKMVHELNATEMRAQEYQARCKELIKELAKVKEESNETINKLNQKLDSLEGKESESQTEYLDRLSKDLAATKAQYHQQINKLSKDIEAIQVSKTESKLSWRNSK